MPEELPLSPRRDPFSMRLLARMVKVASWALGSVYTSGALVVICTDDGHLLLVRPRYRAGWGLAGGFLRRGEQPLETAVRETAEEVGLELSRVTAVGSYVQEGHRHIDHLFAARVASPVPLSPHRAEIRDAGWFPLGELPPLQPEALHALRTWLRWSRESESASGPTSAGSAPS